jgi:hypothetical protein
MRQILLTAALSMIAFECQAATDFQPWLEVGVRYAPTKKLRLELDQHLRFDEAFRGHARHEIMPELAVSWRAARFLRLQAGYRYIAKVVESLEEPYVDSYHRFYADVRLRYRLEPLTLRYRLRLQERVGRPWDESAWQLTHTLRNKVGAEVELPGGFAPFLSGELFVRIDDPDGVLHKWRLTAGLDYEIGSHTPSLFYRYEDVLDDASEPNRHIVGIGYHYAF